MNKKWMAAAVTAAALASASGLVAAQSQGYAQIGFSDYGYADDGLAIKLGVDFGNNLSGVKGLGLTAFYAHTDSDERYASWKYRHDAHVFAFGPTFTYPFPGAKWAFQGRGFLELDRVRWESSSGRHSDTDIGIGIGLGMQYAFDGKTSVRIDYDFLDVGADIFTVGVGFKF